MVVLEENRRFGVNYFIHFCICKIIILVYFCLYVIIIFTYVILAFMCKNINFSEGK